MFDIVRSIKRIAGFDNKKPNQEKAELPDLPNKKHFLDRKIEEVSSFFGNTCDGIVTEFNSIKEKSKNLSATNYDLGMQYLEEGNLKEAIFRFKITKKFWPDNYEAYYQLIICLILNYDFDEAQKVIDELLEKNPNYKEKIDQLTGNVSSSLNPKQPEQITD